MKSQTYNERHVTNQTHGLTTLKRAARVLGRRAIDRRTRIGKALSQWRNDLIQDLGGREAISVQEKAVVDLCVRTLLLYESVMD